MPFDRSRAVRLPERTGAISIGLRRLEWLEWSSKRFRLAIKEVYNLKLRFQSLFDCNRTYVRLMFGLCSALTESQWTHCSRLLPIEQSNEGPAISAKYSLQALRSLAAKRVTLNLSNFFCSTMWNPHHYHMNYELWISWNDIMRNVLKVSALYDFEWFC